MNFDSCKADPDVWFRPGTKDDGSEYYQYLILYTDDILYIGEKPQDFMLNEIGEKFTFKAPSIGPPKQYLGNKMTQVTLDNGAVCWSFSSSQYIQNAVKNIELHLAKKNQSLPARAKSTWITGYIPDIDVTPELSPNDAANYQSLIGILRWIVSGSPCRLGSGR